MPVLSYDRNMIGMITGAKRYILSPPKACPKLGIINIKKHPGYRQSILNYGHVGALNNSTASKVCDLKIAVYVFIHELYVAAKTIVFLLRICNTI